MSPIMNNRDHSYVLLESTGMLSDKSVCQEYTLLLVFPALGLAAVLVIVSGRYYY